MWSHNMQTVHPPKHVQLNPRVLLTFSLSIRLQWKLAGLPGQGNSLDMFRCWMRFMSCIQNDKWGWKKWKTSRKLEIPEIGDGSERDLQLAQHWNPIFKMLIKWSQVWRSTCRIGETCKSFLSIKAFGLCKLPTLPTQPTHNPTARAFQSNLRRLIDCRSFRLQQEMAANHGCFHYSISSLSIQNRWRFLHYTTVFGNQEHSPQRFQLQCPVAGKKCVCLKMGPRVPLSLKHITGIWHPSPSAFVTGYAAAHAWKHWLDIKFQV